MTRRWSVCGVHNILCTVSSARGDRDRGENCRRTSDGLCKGLSPGQGVQVKASRCVRERI